MLGPFYTAYIGPYKGYNPNVNPNIPLEFATTGFRIGHPLLVSDHPLIDETGKTVRVLKLKNLFENPKLLMDVKIPDLFRGISRTNNKIRNHEIIDDVRNFLILEGPGKGGPLFDLFALNIKRGRDHGVPSYNEARRYLGLKPYRSFLEFTQNDKKLAKSFE